MKEWRREVDAVEAQVGDGGPERGFVHADPHHHCDGEHGVDERFAKFGIEVLLATALESWTGNTARLLNLLTGDIEEREFNSLVLATTNRPDDELTRALSGADKDIHTIGDAVQARTAAMAIYEARKLAMTI